MDISARRIFERSVSYLFQELLQISALAVIVHLYSVLRVSARCDCFFFFSFFSAVARLMYERILVPNQWDWKKFGCAQKLVLFLKFEFSSKRCSCVTYILDFF